MAKPIGMRTFAKYGLMDETGLVTVPPIFDEIVSNEFFVLGKFRGEWGEILIPGDAEWFHDETFEDVKIFEDVLWFKNGGFWGARNVNGETLLASEYVEIKFVDGAHIVEADKLTDRKYFFTARGIELSTEVDILEIGSFKLGYAIASGTTKKSVEKRYFIISADDAKVLKKTFLDIDECTVFIEELRNDYVWSMHKDDKKKP